MGRGLRYRIITLALALLVGGCGELTPPSERREEIGYHTVRNGDTLYSIAWNYGVDHRELAAWNNISPPFLIHPGQRLSLTPPLARYTPPSSSRSASTRAKSTTPAAKSPPKPSPAQRSPVRKNSSKTQNRSGYNEKMRTISLNEVDKAKSQTKLNQVWRWPTKGRLVAAYDADAGKKGIDIAGERGQAIFSAAAGDVVYSGSGLLGYGNLVIIKHDDTYLSAYGHNSQLLVKEGDKVVIGQEIAKMGVSPKDGAVLHFEIRKEGKPVDPIRYLPKRN